jgi:hypothetical protein
MVRNVSFPLIDMSLNFGIVLFWRTVHGDPCDVSRVLPVFGALRKLERLPFLERVCERRLITDAAPGKVRAVPTMSENEWPARDCWLRHSASASLI